MDEVLRPKYLRGRRISCLPDLIYVSTRPWWDPRSGEEVGETRMALVMVSGFERGVAETFRDVTGVSYDIAPEAIAVAC